eukprot:g1578.t1
MVDACGLRLCPTGRAWFDKPSATDVAHAEGVECSAMGFCNRHTGLCECKKGFVGRACDRLACPETNEEICSGHGFCVTMKEAAENHDGIRFLNSATTYDLWDAEMIMGCACDEGWSGYDCSERECPTGDDPLTTGQLDEIQTLKCLCTNCNTGTFRISFRGRISSSLQYTATLAEVETALEAIETIDEVTVSWSDAQGASSSTDVVCHSDGRVMAITFLTESGDLPKLSTSSTSTDLVFTVDESTKGTKENAPCNNRGFCTTDPFSEFGGTCNCVDLGEIAFLSSDGKGNVGDRGDCGVLKPGVTISTCPLSSSSSTGTDFCSGHGTCTDATKSCECFPGWKGFNCELRGCPTGRAWFDEASSSNNAHAVAECSNRGACDATTGECTCQEGFEGTACQRLSCPESADGGICNGTGRCVSMREIGELTGVTYGADINSITLWDAGLVYGCKCDEREGNYNVYANNVLDPHLSVAGSGLNYMGYNCALQTCRKGPEKLCPTDTTSMETQTIVCTMATSTPTMEVQTLDCTLTSGTFTVTFDGETTNEIPFDASSASLKESLTNLN